MFNALMFNSTGFLTAINCLSVKLSARSQSIMTITSIVTLAVISITGFIWTITGIAASLYPFVNCSYQYYAYLRDNYDTRCYFNVQSKADMSQLNLPHGTNN